MINFEAKVNETSKDEIIKKYQKDVSNIFLNINKKKLEGSNLTGWRNYTINYDQNFINLMNKTMILWKKEKIKKVILIGIGGSYVGANAAINMAKQKKQNFEIIWVHNFDSEFLSTTLEKIKNEKFAIVVISKSGTTIEPAIAFKLFRDALEKQIGIKNAAKYIFAITDGQTGVLHDICVKNKYNMLPVPNDIGGRFSTLTPVGLLPMILSGVDYFSVLKGANDAIENLNNDNLNKNSSFLYACYRHFLHTERKLSIENFIVYNPKMLGVAEQWRQLFGESEGKNGISLYPSISLFTTDLHAMGQYLQEGNKIFFETTLQCDKNIKDICLKIKNDDDGLLFLNNKNVSYINEIAQKSTIDAHFIDGNVNNLIIKVEKFDAYNYGYLFIWLSYAAMMSAYLLKLNPFNQPGVDAYKKRMLDLLKK